MGNKKDLSLRQGAQRKECNVELGSLVWNRIAAARQYGLLFAFCILLIALSGCKAELYSNLDEADANQMMSILLAKGIVADKRPAKENKWILRVEEEDISRALELLQAEGLPRAKYENLGQIFKKSGLVSSPLEERVRYIYGLSQDLADTISLIDGVMVAKVHIVLPENDPFSEKVKPSSASVFVKCRNASVINANIPRIKKLIINSIEGLSYDKVTVVPFVTTQSTGLGEKMPWRSILGIRVAPSSATPLILLFCLLFICVVAALAMVGWFLVYPRFIKKKE